MTKKTGDLSTKKPPSGGSQEPLLIKNLTVIPGGEYPPISDGAIVLHHGKIEAIGTTPELIARYNTSARMIEGQGYWVTPGLVNAHTHVAMGFFRGLGQGRDQMIESFFPAEKSLTPELLEPLSYSYIYAGLKKGVTTFGDHYYFIQGVGQALDRIGVRGVIGETIADLGGAFPGLDGLKRMEELLEKWSFSNRITPAICPHAADTVSSSLLKKLSQWAQRERLPLHMHLSQTKGERERVFQREGMSPVAFAAHCGALSEATQAVHLVSADEADVSILKAHGVTVGLCPASQILYEKLAPIAAFLSEGLPMSLGTDCAASNDDADMFSEMRLLSLLAKDRGATADSFEADRILAIGTEGGAKSLGLHGKIGVLKVGHAADLVFLKEDIGTMPSPRPSINLLFSMGGSQVRHVMVEGEWVLWNGTTTRISEQDLRDSYLAAVDAMYRRLGRTPAKK